MNFKTAAELNIRQPEYDGLVWFIRKARDGTIPEHDFGMLAYSMPRYNSNPCGPLLCGTQHCIGGWVGIYLENCPTDPGARLEAGEKWIDSKSPALRSLFLPQMDRGIKVGYGWYASLSQAADVAEHFLTFGKVPQGW